MTRLAVSFLLASALLTGCSGPIKTRVETLVAAPLSDSKTYRFAMEQEQQSAAYLTTRKIVREQLLAKGYREAENGTILVQFSVAERPGSIAITSGEGNAEQNIATKKERGFLQSCDDVEHLFSVSLIEELGGKTVYRAKAREFHCNGQLAESLLPLVKAAFSDFGKGPIARPRKRTKRRFGTD